MAFNFFINLFLGGALQQLLGAIKKFAITVHLLITNVRVPTNAQLFFSGLLNFVTFNLIDLEGPLRKSFGLYDDEIVNINFYNLGYHSNYFVINMGNMLPVMLYLLILLMLTGITSGIENERFVKFRTYIKERLAWGWILSFFSESFLVISISTFSNFNRFQFHGKGESLSGVLAVLFGVLVLVGYPLFQLLFLRRNKHRLNEPEFCRKYSTIWDGLKIKQDNWIMIEPFFTSMRILILCSTLLFL